MKHSPYIYIYIYIYLYSMYLNATCSHFVELASMHTQIMCERCLLESIFLKMRETSARHFHFILFDYFEVVTK
jgi:DNA-directed RNA polymerase subunit RPC12/RpoP